jgi:hypothetical protein
LVGFYPFEKEKKTPNKETSLLVKPKINDDKNSTHKSLKDAENLSYDNCLQILNSDDWEVLIETYEENYRKGGFERIFPPADPNKIDYYVPFFEFPRYYNQILWNCLKSKRNFLDKVVK